MMTRKDYIKTANILKGFVDEIPQITYEDLVNEFAEWFKSDNENFDFARFEKACGIDEIGLIPVQQKRLQNKCSEAPEGFSTGLSTGFTCD